MQGGKEQLTWRCTWRWGWRGWRAGRLMLFSPPLFSSWCSSSLPSLCPFFLYFYGFLPLLWSLSLSLSLHCVCSVFFFFLLLLPSFSFSPVHGFFPLFSGFLFFCSSVFFVLLLFQFFFLCLCFVFFPFQSPVFFLFSPIPPLFRSLWFLFFSPPHRALSSSPAL